MMRKKKPKLTLIHVNMKMFVSQLISQIPQKSLQKGEYV